MHTRVRQLIDRLPEYHSEEGVKSLESGSHFEN